MPVRGGGTTQTELRLTARQKMVTTSDKPLHSPEQIRAIVLGRAKQTKRPRLTAPGSFAVLFVVAAGRPFAMRMWWTSLAETSSYQATTPHRVPSLAPLCHRQTCRPHTAAALWRLKIVAICVRPGCLFCQATRIGDLCRGSSPRGSEVST